MDVKELDENPNILMYNHVVAMRDTEGVYDMTIVFFFFYEIVKCW